MTGRPQRGDRGGGALRALATALAAVLVVASAFAAWRLGLFELSREGEPRTDVIVAALALVGGVFSAALTLLGVLLSRQAEDRRLEQARLESDREDAHRERERERLAVESALKAVAELRPDPKADAAVAGSPAAAVHRAGVVLALADLGRFALALTLTRRLLAEGLVSGAAAAWVCDRALRRGDATEQEQACMILQAHAELFLEPNGFGAFPEVLLRPWMHRLAHGPMTEGASALVDLVASRAASEWEFGTLRTLVAALVSLRFGDVGASAEAKRIAGAGLRAFLAAYPPEEPLDWSPDGASPAAMIAQIGADGDAAEGLRGDGRPRAETLEAWRTAALAWRGHGTGEG